jgi:predicted ATP-grasp superfamily ATP-dependent carboligase
MKGGMIIDGFPSAGLINAIASECLIRSEGTELYAIIDSPEFPPLSIVI